MFVFKNISEWSLNKVKGFLALFTFLNLLCMVIIPVCIISSKYKLFDNATTRVKITGVGIIVLVVLGLYAVTKFKETLQNLPQATYKWQCVKFGLLGLFDILPLGIIVLALKVLKDDITLAYSTLELCSISILINIVLDKWFAQFIRAEMSIRNSARLDHEKQNRIDKGLI